MVSSALHDDAVPQRAAPRPPGVVSWDASREFARKSLRKIVVSCEQVVRENGVRPSRPAKRAVASAIVANPWLGTGASRDLAPEAELLAPQLARLLTIRESVLDPEHPYTQTTCDTFATWTTRAESGIGPGVD